MSEFNRQLLNRMTSMLPDGTNAVEKINAIVDRPDAEAYIKAMEPDVFYQLIKDAGWDQGVDLVPYASPSQIQSFVDFDVWRRDQFIPARLDQWLEPIVNEMRDESFKRTMRDLDPEVMVMYVKAHIEVYEPDEEGRIPDDAPEKATLSPDGMHVIVYPEDEDKNALVRALLHRLYELDRVLAWTMLEGVRWELQSEMEEYALRWRTSRLEEMGFVSRVEALQVYKILDPVAVRERIEDEKKLYPHEVQRSRETLDLPAVLSSELDDEFLFVRMLSTITDQETFLTKTFELNSLLNKILVADGIEPGELSSGRQVIRRALGYLSLGLEFLSRGVQTHAEDYIQTLAYKEIFRTGVSLLYKLQRQARQLQHRPTLTIVDSMEYSLLDAQDAALMEGLHRQRPVYGESEFNFELFTSQEQLDQAAVRLSRVAFKQLFTFSIQRLTATDLISLAGRDDLLGEPFDVTLDTLFNTWVLRSLLGSTASHEPLGREELAQVLGILQKAPWRAEDSSMRQTFHVLFSTYEAMLPGGADLLLEHWLQHNLIELDDELGRLSDEAPLKLPFVGKLLLKQD